MIKQTSKQTSISLIRVVAMFLIILCHIFNESGNLVFLGQIFNVGVYTFIFLSAFLYGKKSIHGSTLKWYYARFIRVIVPMYIFMIFLFTVQYFLSGLNVQKYLVFAFNMQGIFGYVQGAGHLWFITMIMFCYLITPILDNLKQKKAYVGKNKYIGLSILIILQIIASYILNSVIALYIGYISVYIFGYVFSYLWDGKIHFKKLLLLTIMTMLAIIIRFIAKFLFDGTIAYNLIVVMYTQSVFGIWIFFAIKYWNEKITLSKNLKIIIENFDQISYEVFIVHYMFFVGPFSTMGIFSSFWLNVTVALILTYVSAKILKQINGRIGKLLIMN
ncbi:MAG: acyltransferase family protein [Culicoidibacterales bacterium]